MCDKQVKQAYAYGPSSDKTDITSPPHMIT